MVLNNPTNANIRKDRYMIEQIRNTITAGNVISIIVAIISFIMSIITAQLGINSQKKIHNDNLKHDMQKKANKLLNTLFANPRVVFEQSFCDQVFDLKAEFDTLGSKKQREEFDKLYVEMKRLYESIS